MGNVSLDIVYDEIKLLRKKVERLEDMLVPEEEFSKKELREIDKLRAEALEEHKNGQTVRVEEL